MTVRQRIQYFPPGGGGIGPTAPGTGGASTAYPPGGYTDWYPIVGGGGGGGGGGTAEGEELKAAPGTDGERGGSTTFPPADEST